MLSSMTVAALLQCLPATGEVRISTILCFVQPANYILFSVLKPQNCFVALFGTISSMSLCFSFLFLHKGGSF